jgi:chromosome segregation ATPase
VIAAAALILGAVACQKKTAADRAQDLQKANAEVAEQRKDVDEASAALDKATDRYKKEKDDLERVERKAREAREKLAAEARRDSSGSQRR